MSLRIADDADDEVKAYANKLGSALGWRERAPEVKGFGARKPLGVEYWVTVKP